MPHRLFRPLIKPFEEFFKLESASGILLLICASLAILIANSPLVDTYDEILTYKLTIGLGKLALSKDIIHWINDGLMAIFFFLVGMEIKRELVTGELRNPKCAILPVGAAIGGMVVPAAIYMAFNFGQPTIVGWGIPMATDIAFALGALAVLGSKRAPKGLAVFLTALAIIDDLGAILVIALFYTEQIYWYALLVAAVVLIALILLNRSKKEYVALYIFLGLLLWLAFLKSGIHATIAGVVLGLTIPATGAKEGQHGLGYHLEHAIHPYVAYGIMPIFALANAGVVVDFNGFGELIFHPVSLGIILGLVVGKPIGIFGASYLMIKFKLADLPGKITMYHIFGASLLSGIGFTMSLFIATLAFFRDPTFLAEAKIGIITASLIAGSIGMFALRKKEKVAPVKDEFIYCEE